MPKFLICALICFGLYGCGDARDGLLKQVRGNSEKFPYIDDTNSLMVSKDGLTPYSFGATKGICGRASYKSKILGGVYSGIFILYLEPVKLIQIEKTAGATQSNFPEWMEYHFAFQQSLGGCSLRP